MLWDPTWVGKENETSFIRVWKPFPSRRVLKALRGNPKRTISISGGPICLPLGVNWTNAGLKLNSKTRGHIWGSFLSSAFTVSLINLWIKYFSGISPSSNISSCLLNFSLKLCACRKSKHSATKHLIFLPSFIFPCPFCFLYLNILLYGLNNV